MNTETHKIRAVRKNKTVEMDVQVRYGMGDNAWIRKADGKPLYGTTGYYKLGDDKIKSYRQETILSSVEWIS